MPTPVLHLFKTNAKTFPKNTLVGGIQLTMKTAHISVLAWLVSLVSQVDSIARELPTHSTQSHWPNCLIWWSVSCYRVVPHEEDTTYLLDRRRLSSVQAGQS